jgi:hypothetical protein
MIDSGSRWFPRASILNDLSYSPHSFFQDRLECLTLSGKIRRYFWTSEVGREKAELLDFIFELCIERDLLGWLSLLSVSPDALPWIVTKLAVDSNSFLFCRLYDIPLTFWSLITFLKICRSFDVNFLFEHKGHKCLYAPTLRIRPVASRIEFNLVQHEVELCRGRSYSRVPLMKLVSVLFPLTSEVELN